MTVTTALAETDALLGGFETEPCPQCKKLTLKRDGATLVCATCGESILEVSRSQYLRLVEKVWPNKDAVLSLLMDNLLVLSKDFPPISMQAYSGFLAKFGQMTERAKSPQECIDELLRTLGHFACPEPGWEGVGLRVIP